MITMLQDWKSQVEINGQLYENGAAAINAAPAIGSEWHVKLLPPSKTSRTGEGSASQVPVQHVQAAEHEMWRITVRQYMTREASPEFDFMEKWNKNVPMPLRTMTGWIEKETRGMVYMHLHGEGMQEITCMRCGRKLTHPISRHYGIGPECMSKLGFVCDIDAVDEIKEKLQTVTWTGWIIKSAITERERV